ncbi:unnamed protein product [Merluccius merluccius]
MCRNLPRRYVIPLTVDEAAPQDQDLVNLSYCKATAKKTRPGEVWRHPGLFPSEPVFVPAPNAAEEDDGVVMSVIITPEEDKSTFLLVLDAKTFTELGRAEVPVNIPYGTHGVFKDGS